MVAIIVLECTKYWLIDALSISISLSTCRVHVHPGIEGHLAKNAFTRPNGQRDFRLSTGFPVIGRTGGIRKRFVTMRS